MSDFDPHISIESLTPAKDVNCTVKELTIDTHRMKIETPLKVLSGKNLTYKAVDELIAPISNPIFEITKSFDQLRYYPTLIHTLEYGGKNKDWIQKLNESIGLKNTLEEEYRKNITLSTVFQYYPLDNVTLRHQVRPYQRMNPNLYESYLDYIYSASSVFILTPDVLLPTQNKRPISIEEYLHFIEFSVESFERQNNKPIFVPLQIDLAERDLLHILNRYKKNGYTNIWINFKAKKCDGSNAGRLRMLSRQIQTFLGDEAVIYCSQLKRERDVKQTSVPAFDMLPPLVYADFIGVNRTRAGGGDMEKTAARKGFACTEDYQRALMQSNCSLFDPETYNYIIPTCYPKESLDQKTLAMVKDKEIMASFFNGVQIYKELGNIRKQITDTEHVRSYLETKDAIAQNMSIFENALKNPSSPEKSTFQHLLFDD
jgi:hypothetical protein